MSAYDDDDDWWIIIQISRNESNKKNDLKTEYYECEFEYQRKNRVQIDPLKVKMERIKKNKFK